MTDFSDFFTQLFTGTGNWLGLLIVISLMVLLMAVNKYAGLLSLILGVLIGSYYLDAGLGWHGITCFIVSAFCGIEVILVSNKG
jgi:hypothetical protein